MNGSNNGKLPILATSIALALGSATVFAQQSEEERTENVQSAEQRLERAEERAEQAEQAVEQREEELQDARSADVQDTNARDGERHSGRDAMELDELVKEHESLSSFMEALEATGLAATLTGDTSYTVFAPTNEAFDEKWNDLQEAENREELIELLRAHIVADDVDADTARTLNQALTVDGGIVEISEEEGELMIGDAKVVDADIQSGNLRVYAIDDVLEPNPAEATAALRDADGDLDRDADTDRDLDLDIGDDRE